MSNLWVNIRFGSYHLQMGNDYPYKITWKQNQYWVKNKPNKWFAVYNWFNMI